MHHQQNYLQEHISKLYKQIFTHFWHQSATDQGIYHQNYLKGLFKSEIKLNYMDEENSQDASYFRNKLSTITDVNMFSTCLIYIQLLQAQKLGFLKNFENFELLLKESLQTLKNFHDKDYDSQVPLYAFWQQTQFKGKTGIFSENVINAKQKVFSFGKTELQYLQNYRKILIGEFPLIPLKSDNDCSSVVIAILGLLRENNSILYEYWHEKNKKISEYYDISFKFAYRPFNPIPQYPEGNGLIVGNYYVLQDFIRQKYQQQGQLILPTSYIDSDPYIFNTIDAVVCSNFLFGFSYMVLYELFNPKKQFIKMIKDTVDLVVYVCNQIIKQKNSEDIVAIFLHYPNKTLFYQYTARIVHLLNKHSVLPEILLYVKNQFNNVLRQIVTPMILEKTKSEKENQIFWVQFLGNNEKKNRNEDAISTTALTLNCLFDIWTVQNQNLTYIQNVPVTVKQVIKKGINFLQNYEKQKFDYNRLSKEIPAFCLPTLKKRSNIYGYEKQVKTKEQIEKPMQTYYWTGQAMTLSSVLLAFCRWIRLKE